MSIKSFMKTLEAETRDVKLDRFEEPFQIKAIAERENDLLKKRATESRMAKGGRRVKDLNTDKYTDLLTVQCVVSPDLDNAELQAYYSTEGDPAATLKAMLFTGEYAIIQQALLDINGFNESEDDLADEVKN